MRLIDAEKLNIYDVSPAYGTCVMGVTEEDIELAPTVDAVPVEFIEKRAKAYGDKAEQCEGTEFIYPYLSERVLNLLIAEWSDRKEK